MEPRPAERSGPPRHDGAGRPGRRGRLGGFSWRMRPVVGDALRFLAERSTFSAERSRKSLRRGPGGWVVWPTVQARLPRFPREPLLRRGLPRGRWSSVFGAVRHRPMGPGAARAGSKGATLRCRLPGGRCPMGVRFGAPPADGPGAVRARLPGGRFAVQTSTWKSFDQCTILAILGGQGLLPDRGGALGADFHVEVVRCLFDPAPASSAWRSPRRTELGAGPAGGGLSYTRNSRCQSSRIRSIQSFWPWSVPARCSRTRRAGRPGGR